MENSLCRTRPSPQTLPSIRNVVGWVREYHLGQFAVEQRLEGTRVPCIPTQEPMLAELPEVARDGDRRCVGVDLRDPVRIVVGLGGAEDKAVDLRRVETDDLDIEVELDLAERLQLYRQQFLVPTGQLGQAVIGDDVCLNLCFGEVAQPDCRDLFEPKQLRRFQTPVARDDLSVFIDQDGVRPAECLDGRSNLSDLLFRVRTGISRIRLEGRDTEMLNLEIPNALRHRTRSGRRTNRL